MGSKLCCLRPDPEGGGKQKDGSRHSSAGRDNSQRYIQDPTNLRARPSIASARDVQLLIDEGKKVVKALYDYTGVPTDDEIQDLSFKKDELMEVTKEDGDWWLARSLQSNDVGYIPSTYVAPYSGLASNDWYHGKISKKDADKLLNTPDNRQGTFLIRDSEHKPGTYALTLLDVVNGMKAVKHYRINILDEGGFFITTRNSFQTLDELVAFYKNSPGGLCCQLTTSCERDKPQMYDLSRETRDHWEISRDELVLTTQLGAGNFGEVWKGSWRGQTDVAVKTMKPGTMLPEKFLEEAEVMKKLRHPRLVALYAVCTVDEPIYIVTELMAGGSLLALLKNAHKTRHDLSIETIIDMAAQVADGMRYIEHENHIHRDLAARNILVGEDQRSVKIGDFGLSRIIEEEYYTMSTGAKFPVKWTSLEAIEYSHFTIKSDVWAYGILLVELTSHGATPYPGMNNQDVVTRLATGFRHPQPTDCPDALYEIMLQCWKTDPKQRPTFEHLFQTLDDFSVSVETGYKDPAYP